VKLRLDVRRVVGKVAFAGLEMQPLGPVGFEGKSECAGSVGGFMVDITTCERCGRVIPLLESGCPYCEQEESGRAEHPYLPLALRLLLVLFCVDVGASIVLATLTLIANSSPERSSSVVTLLALMRVLVAGLTFMAIVFSQPWGRWVPIGFIGFELGCGLLAALGLLPSGAWVGGLLAPLWTLLFMFLFLRDDVQSRFDARVVDRRELQRLIKLVEGGRSDRGSG